MNLAFKMLACSYQLNYLSEINKIIFNATLPNILAVQYGSFFLLY